MCSILRIIKTLITFLCLVAIILFPLEYADHITRAATKDEILDAYIRIDVEWNNYNPGNSNILQAGSFFVEVKGTIIRRPDIDPFFYAPKNLVANYNYQDRGVYVRYAGRCPELYSEQKGSGVVRILDTDEVEDPTKDGQLSIMAGSGWEQSLSLLKELQTKGRGTARQKPIDKEPKTDVYQFVLTVPMATTLKQQSTPCSRYETIPFPTGVALAPYMNLTKVGMYGSYSWRSKTLDTGLQIRDYPGQIQFEPQKGEGNVNYRVSWNFGKIKPMVQIFRITDEGREDITDAKPMKVPVIVGEKITLEAEILPSGTEVTNGEWKIGDSEIDDTKREIIAGYEADDEKGKVITLSKEDIKKKKIEFCWVDGNFGGTPRKVTFTANSKKGEVKGETIITVFKPNVTTKEKVPSREITVGSFENSSCRLYLGKLKIINPPKGKPGMLISHEIKMPTQFSNRPHLLWYVQRIKEEVLEYHDADYFQKVNKEWCLDTHYPYNKMIPAPNKVEMQDSPGVDLGLATNEVHNRDQLETYLMFIPSSNPKDKNNVWVPLKIVEWGWQAAVKRTLDFRKNPPCDDKTFKILPGYYHYPNPTEKDCKKHPEWSFNVKDNERKKINENTWEKLKAAIGNKP